MNLWQKAVLWIILKNKGVIALLDKIKALVDGKKLYILAIGSIIAIIVAWSQGAMDTATAIQKIIEALGAIFLRLGVAKSGTPPAA
jgi:hypothetical protein